MKYKDKTTGKEIKFTIKENEVMVKFAPDLDVLEEVRGMGERHIMAPLHDVDMSRKYGCFKLLSEAPDAESVGETPGVESTIPVLIDTEGNERYFVPGEITVQFEENVSEEEQERLIADKNCTIIKKQFTPGYYTIGLPAGKDIFEAVEEFNALNEVEFSEPSSVGYNDALYIPDDPDFSELWYLHNTGQTGGTPDADVDAPSAWNIERGDPRIAIAIIDTGVDLDHEDLQDNIVPRPPTEDWDFADPDLIPEAGTEGFGYHGTHCAGIAAAVDNSKGVIGMAPGCSILPIRIDLHTGMNQNRADAINFVRSIAHRFDHVVMSCSWKASGDIIAIRQAVINADNAGILVCFSAGNTGKDTATHPQYPGVMPEVFSVAATDHRDVKASFSSFGATVDVSAPGDDIYSSVPDNRYEEHSGTSMACPIVAGLAGLIWSRNPSLTKDQVRQVIENTCDNIDPLNPDHAGKLGHGRINAYRALSQTPVPCKFNVLGKFKFPQRNDGTSSALTIYDTRHPWGGFPWYFGRRYLLFLTQKPCSERIYFMNLITGAVIRSVDPINNETIGSMTWDGRRIRVANVTSGAGTINSINHLNGMQTDTMTAPSGRGEGITYDGKCIYYSTISRIWRLHPTSGYVLSSFPVPGGKACHALTNDRRSLLFAGDSFTNEIIVFEKRSLRIVCRFSAPGRGKERVHGLAYDRWTKTLYIANQSENVIYCGKLSM